MEREPIMDHSNETMQPLEDDVARRRRQLTETKQEMASRIDDLLKRLERLDGNARQNPTWPQRVMCPSR